MINAVFAMPASAAFSIRDGFGDEEIVADELEVLAELVGEQPPALVVLAHTVLDAPYRMLADHIDVAHHQLRGAIPLILDQVAAVGRPRESRISSVDTSLKAEAERGHDNVRGLPSCHRIGHQH